MELTESVRILYNLQIVHSNLPIFFVRSSLLLASLQKLTTLCGLLIENYVPWAIPTKKFQFNNNNNNNNNNFICITVYTKALYRFTI